MADSKLRLALVGLNQTPLDWRGNFERILEGRDKALRLNANLICFPELAISGYGCEDNFLYASVLSRCFQMVLDLAKTCGNEVLMVGLPLKYSYKVYNAVAILNQGRIRGITLKSHLAWEGIHYEPRWFQSWPLGKVEHLEIEGIATPIGTLVYSALGLAFGLEICEDAWVAPPDRPCNYLAEASWIFNCSASHFSIGKADIREALVRESSSRFGVGYAYCNLVGCESGRAIYDGELLVAQNGEVINRSDRLYLDDVRVLVHEVTYPSKPVLAGQVVLELQAEQASNALPAACLRRSHSEAAEEMARAASLALLDYMRKSRARGFTLSLSGGVDSSTVAVLISIMVQRLVHELDLEARSKKLGYFTGLDLAHQDPRILVGALLTTVYQATRNSGPVTRKAAAELAQAVGARHLELEIDDLVEGYKSMISAAIGRPLNWVDDDIALQNIQARVRAPGVWMLANLNGSLLVSTSNRSEVAVGYATMDGDTCGGLAPIAGIEKTFLRRWLLLMEQEGLEGIPPIPVLGLVNQQQPTAELRPPEAVQSDEADLMPYPVLDGLEKLLIAQRRAPLEAFQLIRDQFIQQYSEAELYHWTVRFCRLFAATQWKRERYAPAFHLDDQNLDPKTWARYPILSGVFELELSELAEYYNSTTNS